MAQILNTGAGVYNEWKPSSFDPIEAIKEAGRMEANLAEYRYKVRKEREQEFLNSVDVKTENMIYNSLQGEMKKKLDEFTNFAVGLERKSNGNLSLEDKMLIAQKKREVEQWRDDRLTVAQQLNKKKQIVYADMSPFDFDETQKAITEEEKNILTIPSISTPVMRYESMYEVLDDVYKGIGANWKTTAEEKTYTPDGTNKNFEIRKEINRLNLEDDDKRNKAFSEIYGSLDGGKRGTSYKLQRYVNKKWNDLMELDKQNGTSENRDKYPTPDAYAWKVVRPAFGAPQVVEKTVTGGVKTTTGGGSGVGGKGKFGYITQETLQDPITNTNTKGVVLSEKNSPNGIPISFSGKVKSPGSDKPIGTTGDDILIATRLFGDKVTGQLMKGSKVVDNTIAKNQYNDKLNAEMEGIIWKDIDGKQRTTIKNSDGTYSISVALEPQTVYIDLTEGTNRKDVYTQLKFRTNDPDFEKNVANFVGQKSNTKGNEVKTSTPTKKKLY